MNFPVHVDISNSYVDITAAEKSLGKRKSVRATHRNPGIMGHDYVASSLDVIVALSAPLRAKIEDVAAANKSQYRIRPNDPTAAGRFELTYMLVPFPGRPASFNALGLNALVRKEELPDPDDDSFDRYQNIPPSQM